MGAPDNRDFAGAKLALFIDDRLLVLRRDDKPGLPWPGYLDLPGGGKEAGESPEACVLRETREEVGLVLTREQLVWKRFYPDDPTPAWFFAAHLPSEAEAEIALGDEGQGWMLMPPEAYVANQEAVPHFRLRVRDYLEFRNIRTT
ncbi:NUDIX domain-containing protein [Roseovarius faecimaris]|uniref:NUDIX domain-containing protein n=1 Tax=Roseovarius faecimaris TaxID=2494550 RepID=A0A6I6IN81_9RHOB|nr:NUDIX hydrolase [Roseovarius faecimaris]QGX96957.1 NUDIX domain-containing protein [Roseovarius faecimaris]